MTTEDHTPTVEQSEIISRACQSPANLMINALAGTGKTATLEMIQAAISTKPIMYLAFNKRVVEEAKERFPGTTVIRTFNGLGHRIWQKANASPLTLNGKKVQELLRALIDESPKSARNVIWSVFWQVVDAVARAKALGYVPDGKFTNAKRLIEREAFHHKLEEKPDDLVADLIDTVLSRSIQTAYKGFIDFNDQIYMPALFGGTFPRFPLVKVDEFQDLSPTNHAMLDKLVRERLIGVGDPWQSIYGFRGAKQGGMAEAQEKWGMTGCDLSVSFRCPRAVVEAARWRVPHFKWMKDGGHVETLKDLEASEIPDDAAIICRNNAPLFRVAMHLLSAGRSVQVAGSDIGPKLVGILKKLGDASLSKAGLLAAIEEWRSDRLAKNSTTANDLADCMKVFAGFADTLSGAISYAEHLFAQKGSIRLLTGHKAKGLEWDVVYHLDPWLIDDREQDQNLRYVITTRSKDRLFEIDSARIKW